MLLNTKQKELSTDKLKQYREFLILCSKQFDDNKADKVIGDYIKQFHDNTDFHKVFTKVVLINSLYGTNIFDTSKMASHIHDPKKNIDVRIKGGDIKVIDDIRKGHDIKRKKGNKELDFYSFATKYANWHNPSAFPIFDNLVNDLLTQFKKKNILPIEFTAEKLRDYEEFKSVIDSLKKLLQLGDWNYKKIDKALWICAKFLYRKEQLQNEVGVIKTLEEKVPEEFRTMKSQ